MLQSCCCCGDIELLKLVLRGEWGGGGAISKEFTGCNNYYRCPYTLGICVPVSVCVTLVARTHATHMQTCYISKSTRYQQPAAVSHMYRDMIGRLCPSSYSCSKNTAVCYTQVCICIQQQTTSSASSQWKNTERGWLASQRGSVYWRDPIVCILPCII